MILLYHSVIPDDSPAERLCVRQSLTQSAFEYQIRWLASCCPIVSLADYVAGNLGIADKRHKPVAITFDDGFARTFECIYPFLTQLNIPVTIFVATGHLAHGELLWFSYLKALCFEAPYPVIELGQRIFELSTLNRRKEAWRILSHLAKAAGDPVNFCKSLAQMYPLTQDVSILYEGMSYQQIQLAKDNELFEFGAHTITHPYLPQVSPEQQKQEIVGSQHILSELTGKPVRYFAYPGGEYDQKILEVVQLVGYEAAFAIIPQRIGNPRFEIGRVGIYSQSLLKYRLKVMGVADLARRFGIRTG